MALTLPPPDGTTMVPLCEVESPDVLTQAYLFPEPAETGLVQENWCDVPTSHVKLFGSWLYEYDTPSTVNTVPEASDESPDAENVIEAVSTKYAVSLIALSNVIVA